MCATNVKDEDTIYMFRKLKEGKEKSQTELNALRFEPVVQVVTVKLVLAFLLLRLLH